MFSLYIFYYVLHVLHVRNLNCVLYFIHIFVNIHAHYACSYNEPNPTTCNQHHVLKLTIASGWSQNILLGAGNFKCQFLIGDVNCHGNSLPAREGNGSLSTCDIQSAWAVYIQWFFQLFQAYNSHLTIAIQSRYLLL